MDKTTKRYKCELCYSAEESTTGTMMLTKKEYEFAKRLTDPNNWDNLRDNLWSGHLSVYCEELDKE